MLEQLGECLSIMQNVFVEAKVGNKTDLTQSCVLMLLSYFVELL